MSKKIIEPRIYFLGDAMCKGGYLEKVSVDFSARKIRGSAQKRKNHYYASLKKDGTFGTDAYHFKFDDKRIRIESLGSIEEVADESI